MFLVVENNWYGKIKNQMRTSLNPNEIQIETALCSVKELFTFKTPVDPNCHLVNQVTDDKMTWMKHEWRKLFEH